MARARNAKNRTLPPNLYVNSAGYYYFKNPHKKVDNIRGLGRDRLAAINHARAANAALAEAKPSTLVQWVTGHQDFTLAEWVTKYREMWIKDTEPATQTLRMADNYLKTIGEADFAWRRLVDITTAHFSDLIRTAEAERGPGTAANLRARAADLFRMAETEGHIEVGRNPVSATYAPSREVFRERITLEQFKLIHAHAPKWLQRAMHLALLTAQRREDIVNMRFADVVDGHLQIIQGKGKGTVRLRQDLRIRLDAAGMTVGDAVTACRDLIVSRHMIHHVSRKGQARPGEQITPNAVTGAFAVARDKAGIVAAEGRTAPSFHEIRSLAERLYRDQYGAEFAQAMLGHKQAKTTAKYDDLRGQGWQVISAS